MHKRIPMLDSILYMLMNDAIREYLVLYETLGKLRVQEDYFASFQLACYHRDCCLKDLNLEGKELIFEKGKTVNFL